ncbi:hypothetical protein FRC04_003546 [Tulasnella sp. 424]|nr:hypothetical protein FRC04_003546 [Tulasnella sp. 424]KAG8974964.1 hypothetical protein FRC05_006641 [Tulasnella sp. 425]
MFSISSQLAFTLAFAISATAAPLLTEVPSPVGFARQLSPGHQFGTIVVFGDSFSDDGHGAWVISNHTWPADPAYYNHTFSNGPVWPVVLSESLNIASYLKDKATGGATSDNALVQGYTGANSTIPVPSMLDQITQYIAVNQTSESYGFGDILYALVIGSNDIFINSAVSAESVFQAIVKGMKQLQDSKGEDLFLQKRKFDAPAHSTRYAGASSFLLASFPDLALLPFAKKYTPPEYQTTLSTYSKNLADLLSSLAQNPPNGTRIAYLDLYTLFPQMLANPESFGFSPEVFDQNCINGVYSIEAGVPRSVCSDPDARVFWDIYHPSAKTHKIIAEEAFKAQGRIF